MAQNRTMYGQAVNVSLHNHSDADYKELIYALYNKKARVNYRSHDYIMISSIWEKDSYIYGTFAKFVEVDREGDWFDFVTGEKAEDQVVASINIPPNLFPNLSTFLFRFDPNLHLLVFESYGTGKSLTAGTVEKYFEEALNDPSIVQSFGGAEVSVVADHNRLEEVFSIERLTKIKIVIKRPNSDYESDDFERKILADMEVEGVRKIEIERFGIEGRSMTLSDETRAYAKVGAQNGEVQTQGIENETVVNKSTSDIPLREGLNYDPENLSEENVLDNIARTITQKYRS